ncbi:TIGR03936 family radical SAM-associated protein [soil metagenome]
MKLRVRSTKLGKVRFVGHRDMARIWDRTLRRLGIPVAFTQGFTPRPKISFGLALPMGAESLAEYVDVDIDTGHVDGSDLDLDALPSAWSAMLPDGIDVTVVAEPLAPVTSLQESVTSCTWEMWSPEIHPEHLESAIGLLDSDELLVERERKRERRTDDVRPLLLDLRLDPTGRRLVADLATTGRALRPAELAKLAFPHVDPFDVRVLRTHQWTSHDDHRREVLPQPVSVAAPDREVGA